MNTPQTYPWWGYLLVLAIAVIYTASLYFFTTNLEDIKSFGFWTVLKSELRILIRNVRDF